MDFLSVGRVWGVNLVSAGGQCMLETKIQMHYVDMNRYSPKSAFKWPRELFRFFSIAFSFYFIFIWICGLACLLWFAYHVKTGYWLYLQHLLNSSGLKVHQWSKCTMNSKHGTWIIGHGIQNSIGATILKVCVLAISILRAHVLSGRLVGNSKFRMQQNWILSKLKCKQFTKM